MAKRRVLKKNGIIENGTGVIRVDINNRYYIETTDGKIFLLADRFQEQEYTYDGAQIQFSAHGQSIKKLKAQKEQKPDRRKESAKDRYNKRATNYTEKKVAQYNETIKTTVNPRPPKLKYQHYPQLLSQFDLDELRVFEKCNLPVLFSQDAQIEAFRASKERPEAQLPYRVDLRNLEIVTIDPPDAKDLDDAISYEILENGNVLLGVHIADVAHYVNECTAPTLFKEALERGTSTYLPNKVIPMIPEILSSSKCSLTEGQDRLAVSTFMEIDKHGNVVQSKVSESIINVSKRFTYDEVTQLLNDGPLLGEDIDVNGIEYLPLLQQIDKVTKVIAEKRRERGEISFETQEPKITKNEKTGEIENIEPYPYDRSNEIVATAMILCNETIASTAQLHNVPFVYRVHESPASNKLIKLTHLLNEIGVEHEIDPDDPGTSVADAINNLPPEEKRRLSSYAISCMQAAYYTTENKGHFGLGSDAYAHTTSPIRRAPDLFNQTVLKQTILTNHQPIMKELAEIKEQAESVAKMSSANERRSDDVTRELTQIYKHNYIQGQVGNTFAGTVGKPSRNVVHVTLDDNGIKGILKLGRKKSTLIRGQAIQVTVSHVDKENGKVIFTEAEQITQRTHKSTFEPYYMSPDVSNPINMYGDYGDEDYEPDYYTYGNDDQDNYIDTTQEPFQYQLFRLYPNNDRIMELEPA